MRSQIVMLWDNHPIHQRKTVTEFITKHPRLHVYNFPAYAPEVNPTEGVWAQSKESTAGTAPRNLDELHRNVQIDPAHTQFKTTPSRVFRDTRLALLANELGDIVYSKISSNQQPATSN